MVGEHGREVSEEAWLKSWSEFGKERGVSSLKGGREEGPVLARYDLAWRRKRARLM